MNAVDCVYFAHSCHVRVLATERYKQGVGFMISFVTQVAPRVQLLGPCHDFFTLCWLEADLEKLESSKSVI